MASGLERDLYDCAVDMGHYNGMYDPPWGMRWGKVRSRSSDFRFDTYRYLLSGTAVPPTSLASPKTKRRFPATISGTDVN